MSEWLLAAVPWTLWLAGVVFLGFIPNLGVPKEDRTMRRRASWRRPLHLFPIY